jgi:alkanesulfonate monooxygenase SsuD/methylene tetrahydromethanopterin reductase-like flavin-dependent oxidoreductase (luciferase family)
MGAGWQKREHQHYGWDLLGVKERMDRFEEGLEVVTRLLNSDEPVHFEGDYYRIEEAVLLPRPKRQGGPPILIGGNGTQRTLPLVAKYASEWNGVFVTPERFADLSSRLDELLVANGRQPEDVRRSLMIGTVFGRDQARLDDKLKKFNAPVDELTNRGMVVGTGAEVAGQLAAYEAAGLQRVMLQWLDLDDLDGLAGLAEAVL